jgi:hypothetical protein
MDTKHTLQVCFLYYIEIVNGDIVGGDEKDCRDRVLVIGHYAFVFPLEKFIKQLIEHELNN